MLGKTVENIEWKIELETALAYGRQKLIAAKEAQEQAAVKRMAEIRMAWEVYSAELRTALPEVLQPMMNNLLDDQDGPGHPLDEVLIINGEAHGLAPMAVHLSRRGNVLDYKVACYEVAGVFRCWSDAHQARRLMFGFGDEAFMVNPHTEYDVEVALARALETMVGKRMLEATREVGELEYEAAVEDVPGVQIANKAMEAAIRAIVRDELRNGLPD